MPDTGVKLLKYKSFFFMPVYLKDITLLMLHFVAVNSVLHVRVSCLMRGQLSKDTLEFVNLK